MPGCGDDILRKLIDISCIAKDTLTETEKEMEKLHQKEYEEMELAYQAYKVLTFAYEGVIAMEDDPTRKQILIGLLEDIHDENK